MAEQTLRQENQQLKEENDILKIVLASVVVRGNKIFKAEDLTVDVRNDEVFIHAEEEFGSLDEGYTLQQFKWRYPLNKINNNKINEQQEVSTNKILNVGSPFLTQEKPTICNNQEIDENLNVNNLNSEERNKAMSVVKTPENRSSPVIYSIVITCLDSGEKLRLQVESSDTIAKVKDRIGNKLKCPPKKLVLQLVDSGVLQDGKTVSDYYIRNNTDVALIVKTNTNMQILIRTLTGHTSFFMVNPTTTIAKLKLMYYNFVGIPCDQQRFVSSDGQQLEDGKNCSDYDITNGSVVYFFCKLRGC